METMNTNAQTETKTSTAANKPTFQEGPDIDNANAVYQDTSLDATEDSLRTEKLKPGNKHATNSLVARMLWGHEEKVSLNARVSEDGTLDLNDDVR
ncbi:hypothetical protein [Sporomusa acidovorans]|uniref:Uncharacterized protein n=1 Tax=Sporomusa acidovorans (strain ATCC 49682 / DSM 3132 / Mol) TaxID=1123286 RepID=A0ABZ3IYZ5_SPOA4|nr:hypothetical protein [Sporomusa acidovorans]OZC22093.1 hypothetical protein SPACI_16130 [Sporomusa acidovorans DSM 3132]SDF66270.1 hypothetical protein SAMN04488499_106620 [Sporomusa acidovorans]